MPFFPPPRGRRVPRKVFYGTGTTYGSNCFNPSYVANLGPGFDSLGLALQLYNRFEVEECEGDPSLPTIEVQGPLGAGLSTGPDNLFFRSFAMLFERLGVPVPSVRIWMSIHIPPGCGLGSSATAVVGGLIAANEWVRSQELAVPKEDLLDLAVEAEAGNHPDNVAPALLGGLVATTRYRRQNSSIKTPFPRCAKSCYLYSIFSDGYCGKKVATCQLYKG